MTAAAGKWLTWGILGTGAIARTFAEGIAASESGTLIAVGSRAQETADRFADTYGVERRYASYEALLADPDVQAVYISLPNHLHAEWTIKCAQAGKHILCEKPLTTNYAEAMTVVEEVRRCDVFLMEAFMYRCHPQTARLKQLLKEGVIGEVRLIQSAFSYNMGPRYENIRLSNPAAGGGIMDVGCYTTSMARLIAGAEPVDVTGVAHIGEISRVDERAVGCLRFPSGIVASLVCGTQVHVDGDLRIWGADGSIQVPNPWFPGKGANRILIHKDGEAEPREILVEGPGELYAIEADSVARHIAERQAPSPCMTWADSLGNMKTLDAWRRAVGLTFDVEQPEALRRPAPPRRADAPMTYGRIPGIDKPVARLVMGSIALTSRDMPFTCAMLDYYVSLGGNAIDTAYHYGEKIESAIGQWMQLRGNRDQIVIVGKGAHHSPRGPRVNRDAIAADLAASLECLQTDYIDLYLLHRDDPAVPVGEIVEWLNEHYRAGRIRAFGGSNWTTGRLQAAIDYAREHGLVPFVASSPNLSLAIWNEPPWKDCLSATVEGKEWYTERQFPLLAWSSQAQGFFTGRYAPEDRSNPNMVRTWYNEANFERLERARELGRRKGVSANAIALAYVLCQPFPTFPLIGPYTLEEIRTSCEALRVSLTSEELPWLNLE
jgi:predicted dehydrogenase/aryl-alcohol dehydrogenase-like predicted oxidoreductase